MQLGIGELAGQREGGTRIADDPEHDMWIRVGVDRIGSGRHA
jgi:hypothetical protein